MLKTDMTNEKSTAVIYARFSSDKQREESIEGQIRECTQFAKDQNLEIIATYIDRALSARSDNRPDFLRMIADSSKGLFQYVIVYQLDRFSRSRYDSAVYKHKLKKNGVRVLSAKERIGDEPSSIILESMLEGYAEYYSAELSQKVKRGMTENVLEHKWTGGYVPLGYSLAPDKTLQIDPSGAEAVKIIYEKWLSGYRIMDIIRYLNEHNYVTSRKSKFRYNSLNRILTNPIYTGLYRWGTIEVADYAPAIITQKQFALAQEKIHHIKAHPRAKRRSAAYALTGIIYCGVCGSPMTGQSGHSKSGALYHYYRCSTKNNYHDRGKKLNVKCTNRNISREKLEDLVLQTTINILMNPEAVRMIAKQAVAAQEKDPAATEIDRIKEDKKLIQKKLSNSIKAVEAGIISTTLAVNISQYEKEIADLDIKMEKIKLSSTPVKIDEIAVEFFLKNLLLQKKEHDKYRLDMFQTFIRRVIVYPDKVEIQYNYTATPILENPVIKMMTGNPGCSRCERLVTR
ncbi:recombinase family protein [Megasphaera elsdenii]|uniref:recombinase family protein n=1 Tax=Megasphaera elsdenii TaxID=907 RepID=UPI00242A8C18|nr:recombinase family protein [Megasphaera elsdenii]